MSVKSVVVAGLLMSAGMAAGAQSKAAKAAAKPPANLHLTVAATGNEARYRVREHLAGFDFPTDAVGKTSEITGLIVVSPGGKVAADSSRIIVNVQHLKSDKSSRDRYIRANSIESNKFPNVIFNPKSFAGLKMRPGSKDASFMMLGDLVVHGTKHPVTWMVTAHSEGQDIVGSASTKFTFQDFGLEPPKKSIIIVPISVNDSVKLEYDFHFVEVPPQ